MHQSSNDNITRQKWEITMAGLGWHHLNLLINLSTTENRNQVLGVSWCNST